MDVDGLFVYGTLRTGGARHLWLERTQPLGITLAFASGRLFHLPEAGHPAMVPTPAPPDLPPSPGWITGEFVGYEDGISLQQALEDLDAVEGVPEGLYQRTVVPVHLASGHQYNAWVYVFTEERLPTLVRHAVEITTGDWSEYLRQDS